MTYDFDLCDNAACPKKESCKRYRAHEEVTRTKYSYPLWYVAHDNMSEDCTYFIEYTLDKNK